MFRHREKETKRRRKIDQQKWNTNSSTASGREALSGSKTNRNVALALAPAWCSCPLLSAHWSIAESVELPGLNLHPRHHEYWYNNDRSKNVGTIFQWRGRV
jgi:hypothetical protein